MTGNNLTRFLHTDDVRPARRHRRTLRGDLARLWAWCIDVAHGGWIVAILLWLVALARAIRLEAQAAELARLCGLN